MDREKEKMRLSTAAIHAGFRSRESYRSAAEPMLPATTFTFPSAEAAEQAFEDPFGEDSDFIYSRMTHPNAVMVEERLTAIEPGAGASAIFASGESAIFGTLFASFNKYYKLGVINPVYGGTHHMIDTFFFDSTDYQVYEYDARGGIPNFPNDLDIVFFETPTNPTLVMVDIDEMAKAAKKANPNCVVVVDNTFLGALQTPFTISEHVDIVVYSGTKYMGGHSNLLCGVAIARQSKEHLILDIKRARATFGGILHPFECWQLLNSLKTYTLRMRIQSKGAQKVAEFLASHQKIECVDFPGLWTPEDKYYHVYKKQCTDPGAMITFYLRTSDKKAVFKFQNLLQERHHILLAVSLGGVESLLCHPASTTHKCVGQAELKKYGITENLIRLSVGLEEPEVLIEDLDFALNNCE